MKNDKKFINKQVQLFIHQTICLTHAEKKKILGHYNKVANDFLITFKKIQKQPPEVFYKKAVFLKKFAIFTGQTGKRLFWSLFLIQNIAKFLRAPILKNICE